MRDFGSIGCKKVNCSCLVMTSESEKLLVKLPSIIIPYLPPSFWHLHYYYYYLSTCLLFLNYHPLSSFLFLTSSLLSNYLSSCLLFLNHYLLYSSLILISSLLLNYLSTCLLFLNYYSFIFLLLFWQLHYYYYHY